jgi:hypothetical protein
LNRSPQSTTTQRDCKKGEGLKTFPFFGSIHRGKARNPYLVFASSFFISSFFSGIASFAGSAAFCSPAGAAASGAGAAGAGGGGGGAGSSFLPHPTNVSVKAKRVIADNETNFFPILDSPPFPSHIFTTRLLLTNFYYTSLDEIQAELRLQLQGQF